MKTLKRSLSLVLIVLTLVSLISVAASAITFDDYSDKTTIQYKVPVGVLTGMNILEGTDGALRPKDNVTRAEAAAMIVRAILGRAAADNLPTKSPSTFSDLGTTHWANKYVEYGYEHKLINGVGDGLFNPNGNVTGYEFAKMILGALGYNKNNEFTGGDWALEVAKVAIIGGIFNDLVAKDNVDPNNAAKREETALYLYNGMTAMYYVGYTASTGSYTPVLDPNLGYVITIGAKIYQYTVPTDEIIIVDNAWTNKSDAGKTETIWNGSYTYGVNTDLSLINHNVKIHFADRNVNAFTSNNAKVTVYYVEDLSTSATVTAAIQNTAADWDAAAKRAGFKGFAATTKGQPNTAYWTKDYNTSSTFLTSNPFSPYTKIRGAAVKFIDWNGDGFIDLVQQVSEVTFARLDNITITNGTREYTFTNTKGTNFFDGGGSNSGTSATALKAVYEDYIKSSDTLAIGKFYLVGRAIGQNATTVDGMFYASEAKTVTGTLTKVSYSTTAVAPATPSPAEYSNGYYTIDDKDYQIVATTGGSTGGDYLGGSWVANNAGSAGSPFDALGLATIALPAKITAYLAPDGSIVAYATSSGTKTVYVSNLDWTSSNLASTQGLTAHVWFADGTADGQYFVDQTAANSALTGFYYNWNYYGDDSYTFYVNQEKNKNLGGTNFGALGLYEFTDLGNGKCALRLVTSTGYSAPVIASGTGSTVRAAGSYVGDTNFLGNINSVTPGIATVSTSTTYAGGIQANATSVFFYVTGSEANGDLSVKGRTGIANALKPAGTDIEAYGTVTGTTGTLKAALFPGDAADAATGTYFYRRATTGATLNPRKVTEYGANGTATKYYVDVYDLTGIKSTLVFSQADWETTYLYTGSPDAAFFKASGGKITTSYATSILTGTSWSGGANVPTAATFFTIGYSVNSAGVSNDRFSTSFGASTWFNFFQGTDTGTVTVNLVTGQRTVNTTYAPADGSVIANWVKDNRTVYVATASSAIDGAATAQKLQIVFILGIV